MAEEGLDPTWGGCSDSNRFLVILLMLTTSSPHVREKALSCPGALPDGCRTVGMARLVSPSPPGSTWASWSSSTGLQSSARAAPPPRR